MIVCVLLPLSMFGAKPGFLNAETGDPETNRLIASLPPDAADIHFTFETEDWLTIVGVASRMKHEHRRFCVDDGWAFTFGEDNLCQQLTGLTNVRLTHSPRSCEPPCRILTKDDHFEFQLNPYTPLKLPFTIEPDDIISLNKGYYGSGKGPVWASGLSTIHFLVAPDLGGASGVRVRIFGSANAGRPTRVLLNGHPLGTMVASQESTEFVTQRTAFLPGENQLVIQVDHSAHEKNDPRILGFLLTKAQFKPVEQ